MKIPLNTREPVADPQPARSLVGPRITSSELADCSVTALEVSDGPLSRANAPVGTPALTWGG